MNECVNCGEQFELDEGRHLYCGACLPDGYVLAGRVACDWTRDYWRDLEVNRDLYSEQPAAKKRKKTNG